MVKMLKGHLRDTGLINYFLRINDVDDLKSHPQFGRIWETFIIEQLIRSFNNYAAMERLIKLITHTLDDALLALELDRQIHEPYQAKAA